MPNMITHTTQIKALEFGVAFGLVAAVFAIALGSVAWWRIGLGCFVVGYVARRAIEAMDR